MAFRVHHIILQIRPKADLIPQQSMPVSLTRPRMLTPFQTKKTAKICDDLCPGLKVTILFAHPLYQGERRYTANAQPDCPFVASYWSSYSFVFRVSLAMVDWLGLAFPIAYLTILIGALATFSYLYRKRQDGKYFELAKNAERYIKVDDILQPNHYPSNHGSASTSSATYTSPSCTSNPTPHKRNRLPCQIASSKQRCCKEQLRISGAYSRSGMRNPL